MPSKPYTFVPGTPAEAAQVNSDLDTLFTDVNNNVVRKDGSIVMTGQLILPNTLQTTANQACSVGKAQSLIGAPAIPGMIGIWGGAAVPTGWLHCDGSAVSRATYANLFSAIGTTHGAGNGSTTFNIPDLQGRSPMGAGTGLNLTGHSPGQKWGTETSNQDTVDRFNAPVGGAGEASAYYHYHSIVHPVTIIIFVIKF